jgi:hypothetical protein
VTDRAHATAESAATLRLEGLAPSALARRLGDAWVRGDIADEDLREAERRLLAGEAVDEPPAPAGAPRAA